MPFAGSIAKRLLGERGRVTWVTLLLLGGLATGVYLAWVFGPIYVVHYEVKQVVRDYGNQAVKNKADEALVAAMVHKIRTLDYEWTEDELGRPKKIPAIDLRPQDVVWERIADPPSLHVSFAYVRVVKLPWLGRTVERVMPVDITMDLALPDWGPAR